MTAPAWTLERLSARQAGRLVLDVVSMEVSSGELVGVLGPNGAGKSTLIKAGLGLMPASGRSLLSGKSILDLSDAARAALVGYLPQERRVGWNLPAWRIAALGAPNAPPAAARDAAMAALERVGLADLSDRGVLDMSGGERARVLLARLLATGAPLLVADEPAAGLDPDAQLMILEQLRGEAQRGAAVAVSLHDLTLAARLCDRLVVIDHGRIVAEGPPREALSPQTLREVFRLDGDVVDTAAGLVVAAKRTA